MLMGIPAIAMFCCGMSSLTSNSRYAHVHTDTCKHSCTSGFVGSLSSVCLVRH